MTKETAVLVSLFCMSRCLDIQIPVSVIKLICLWPVNFGCSAHMPWLLLQQVTLQGMLVFFPPSFLASYLSSLSQAASPPATQNTLRLNKHCCYARDSAAVWKRQKERNVGGVLPLMAWCLYAHCRGHSCSFWVGKLRTGAWRDQQ
eukprot:1138166-Pelagomonas_calceolata.AAC.1